MRTEIFVVKFDGPEVAGFFTQIHSSRDLNLIILGGLLVHSLVLENKFL